MRPVREETCPFDGRGADHIKPWRSGGKTTLQNCPMPCIKDSRLKSGY